MSHKVAFVAVDTGRWQVLRRERWQRCTEVDSTGSRTVLTILAICDLEPVHDRVDDGQPPGDQAVIAVAFHSELLVNLIARLRTQLGRLEVT